MAGTPSRTILFLAVERGVSENKHFAAPPPPEPYHFRNLDTFSKVGGVFRGAAGHQVWLPHFIYEA